MAEFVCDRIFRCPGWERNQPKIDGIFSSAYIHGVKYDGDFFKFCPWCGKEIMWRDSEYSFLESEKA